MSAQHVPSWAPSTSPALAYDPTWRLDDLVLPTRVLSQVRTVLDEWDRADLLRSHNVEPCRRILLAGEHGSGKQWLAEAIVAELGRQLCWIPADTVVGASPAATAAGIMQLMQTLQAGGRYIAVIDGVELLAGRMDMGTQVSAVAPRTFCMFLKRIITPIICVSDQVEKLDSSVYLAMDTVIRLPLPNADSAIAWLQKMANSCGYKLQDDALQKLLGSIHTISCQALVSLWRRVAAIAIMQQEGRGEAAIQKAIEAVANEFHT